jgi:hypothetical protein
MLLKTHNLTELVDLKREKIPHPSKRKDFAEIYYHSSCHASDRQKNKIVKMQTLKNYPHITISWRKTIQKECKANNTRKFIYTNQ